MPGIDDLDPDRDRVEVALAPPTGSARVKGAPGFWHEAPNSTVLFNDIVGTDLGAGIAKPLQRRLHAGHAGIVEHQHIDAYRVVSAGVIGRDPIADLKRDHSGRAPPLAICS